MSGTQSNSLKLRVAGASERPILRLQFCVRVPSGSRNSSDVPIDSSVRRHAGPLVTKPADAMPSYVGAAPGAAAWATPIIESRVTSAASCVSVSVSLPSGRRGITR